MTALAYLASAFAAIIAVGTGAAALHDWLVARHAVPVAGGGRAPLPGSRTATRRALPRPLPGPVVALRAGAGSRRAEREAVREVVREVVREPRRPGA